MRMLKSANLILINFLSAHKSQMIKNWLLAIRPKTLMASVAPVLAGSSIAVYEGHWSLLNGLLALFGALLLQIESNFVNDYFDWKKGSDTKSRLGPTRVTSAGLIKPRSMKRAIALVALSAVVIGALLVASAGWEILAIGIAGLLCAFLYTAGPLPLAYLGLGDVFVFIFFGVIAVTGTTFVHTGAWSETALLASIPIGLVAVAILLVNNVRDFQEDSRSQKKTLVVRLGVGFGQKAFGACVILPPVYVAALALTGTLPLKTLLTLVTLPMGASLYWQVLNLKGASLNILLAQTGKLLFLFSLFLSLGFVL